MVQSLLSMPHEREQELNDPYEFACVNLASMSYECYHLFIYNAKRINSLEERERDGAALQTGPGNSLAALPRYIGNPNVITGRDDSRLPTTHCDKDIS
jgi:hypothetical protein